MSHVLTTINTPYNLIALYILLSLQASLFKMNYL